jgi:hypothetical protein
VTSAIPVPAELYAVSSVSLTIVTFVAGFVPKSTAVARVKPVPMTVTGVPPDAGPTAGLIDESVGATTYVNWSAGDGAELPPGLVTVTSTVPVPVGLSAVIVVPLTMLKLVAGMLPKSTAVAPAKPVPWTVTDVPPINGPAFGLNPVTLVGVIRSSRDSSASPHRRRGRERSASWLAIVLSTQESLAVLGMRGPLKAL